MFNNKPTKKNPTALNLTKIGEWLGNGIGGRVGFSPRRLRELQKWISERDTEDPKRVSYYRQFEALTRGAFCLYYGISLDELKDYVEYKKKYHHTTTECLSDKD